MKKLQIESFEIQGLFGTDNVLIPFDDGIKILVGENGIGKTQVLNLFYYILTANFYRLIEFEFSTIKLAFRDNQCVEISKSQIGDLIEQTYKSPIIKDFIQEFGFSYFEILRNKFLRGRNSLYKFANNYMLSPRGERFPVHRIFRELEDLDSNNKSSTYINQWKKIIDNELKGKEILYFPTYRRVEEDLYNLGFDEFNEEELDKNTLIQFGMNDVKKSFKHIQNTINKLLKEGLAQFTKDVLNVVIDEKHPEENVFEKINESDIDLILSRVGGLLPDTQKNAIKNIVAGQTLKNPLTVYLLQKLIEAYEKQKTLDNAIKAFRDACNKYLSKKKVVYDESAIKIFVSSYKIDNAIDLKYLSSGEKQIISMFSKVYLSELDQRFIILIDEPELSLSMLWQKKLLPDIVNSQKCDFLLAVTHSPFIFENELDKYAIGLNEYFLTNFNMIKNYC